MFDFIPIKLRSFANDYSIRQTCSQTFLLNGRISICRGGAREEKEEEEATAKAARFGDVVQSKAQPSPSTDLDSLPAQILLHRYRDPRHQRNQILVRSEER